METEFVKHTMYKSAMPLYDARLTIFAAEHDSQKRDKYNPPGYMDQILDAVSAHDIIVPEYVPNELKQKAFKFPVLGKIEKKSWGDESVDPFFDPICITALHEGKRLMAVDPANSALLGFYQMGEFLGYLVATMPYVLPVKILNSRESINLPTIPFNYEDQSGGQLPFTWLEKTAPTTIDARRYIYARGLMQIAKENPRAEILTITPPAHAKRIEWYLKNTSDPRSVFKSVLYRALPIGITRQVREFSQNGEVEKTRIRF